LAGSCAAQWVGACRGGVGRRHHWFAHSTGGKADMPLAMMATIVQGDAGTASPTVGVLVPPGPVGPDRRRVRVGRAAAADQRHRRGRRHRLRLLLYVVNFLVLAPLLFTTFQAANQPFEVFAHLVFSTLLSLRSTGRGCVAASRCWAIQRRSAGALP
jgi:hypothetical protein